jgi:hypothetical protein
MTGQKNPEPDARLLTAYLEGETPPAVTEALEVELAGSPATRACLDQLRAIRASLAAPMPEIERIDLVSRVRAAREEATAARRTHYGRWLAMGALAASVALAATTFWPTPDATPEEFRAKSVGSGHGEARRARVAVYRVARGRQPEPLGSHMSRSDGLLLSYTNVGFTQLSYLAVFAVDASKEVRWFYPSYEHAGLDPLSIRVASEVTERVLPEVIEHDFAVGPMTIYALFTAEPLRVSEVEAWLARSSYRVSAPPTSDGLLHELPVMVGGP